MLILLNIILDRIYGINLIFNRLRRDARRRFVVCCELGVVGLRPIEV